MDDEYLNKLYISKDFHDIIKFYYSFDNKEEIINWMKRRPKMKPNLVELNKDADNYAIVIIPTIDSNGKWLKNDKEIFDGLHIIFAENENKKPNPYFDYAFSVNTGIAKALEYKPKWIIVSNDDMFKIDDISKLIDELKESENYDALFFPKSTAYSNEVTIAKPRLINIYRLFFYWRRNYRRIENKLKLKFEVLDFKNKGYIYKNLMYNRKIKVKHHQGCFIVINTDFIASMNGKLFDDTFINGHEDTWLYYKHLQNRNFKLSNFNIGIYIGSSLGIGFNRYFQEIANEIYFEYLLDAENNNSLNK